MILISLGVGPEANAFKPRTLGELLETAYPGVVSVTKSGTVGIEPANRYSENTTVEAAVLYPILHPRAGEVVTKFNGTLRFSETNETSYHGFSASELGATRLPVDLQAVSGKATLVLKSLSGHDVNVAFPGPPPATIQVSSTKLLDGIFSGDRQILQWVDEDGDPGVDWLMPKARAILRCLQLRTSGESGAVYSSIDSVVMRWVDCGATQRNDDINEIGISPRCGPFNGARLNLAGSLTQTIAHEGRHSWVFRELRRNQTSAFIKDDDPAPGTFANDDDRDNWPEYLQGFAGANDIIEAAGQDSHADPEPGGAFGQSGPQETDAYDFAQPYLFSQCNDALP